MRLVRGPGNSVAAWGAAVLLLAAPVVAVAKADPPLAAVPSPACTGSESCPDLTVQIRNLPDTINVTVPWTFSVAVRNVSGTTAAHIPRGTHLVVVQTAGYEQFEAPDNYWCTQPFAPTPASIECAPAANDVIQPRSERVFKFTVVAPVPTSTGIVQAAADPTDAIAETDESNNSTSKSYSAEFARLVIEASEPCHASLLSFGSTVDCDFRLLNAGPNEVNIGAGAPVISVALGNTVQQLEAPTGFKLKAITSTKGVACSLLRNQLRFENDGAILCRSTAQLKVTAGQQVARVTTSLIAMGNPPGLFVTPTGTGGGGVEADYCELLAPSAQGGNGIGANCVTAGGSVGD